MCGPEAIQGPELRRQQLGWRLFTHHLEVLTTFEQETMPRPHFSLTLGPAEDASGSESTTLLFPLTLQNTHEFKCVVSLYNVTTLWTG